MRIEQKSVRVELTHSLFSCQAEERAATLEVDTNFPEGYREIAAFFEAMDEGITRVPGQAMGDLAEEPEGSESEANDALRTPEGVQLPLL